VSQKISAPQDNPCVRVRLACYSVNKRWKFWCWETEFELDQRKKKKNEIDLLINSQQMVLSVILHAGAVPLSLEDQVHYYPSSSTTFQSSTIFQSSSPASPEYVQHLEELVGELSGVFATFIHQNPPPSSPTSLADMYHH
jgi:hypothetical protein